MRGIDFLARHAHHESFEYPLGSFQGGAIQRPLKELSSDEEDHADRRESNSTNSQDHSESNDDLNGKGAQGPSLKGPVLAAPVDGRLGGAEALYPYLVVCVIITVVQSCLIELIKLAQKLGLGF